MAYSDISQALKDIATVSKKLHDQEINSKIIDLQGMVIDLMLENQDLRQKLNTVGNFEKRKNKLKKLGNYWAKDEETLNKFKKESYPYSDEVLAGIYCSTCLLRDNKFVSVNNRSGSNSGTLMCPVCNRFGSVNSH